ncbi:hypothetical protein MCOR10_009743 [Pyricularia oryzae]|nr:hypothetical protein MCOR10_009743 [Pyricularia oryzae]
MDSLPVELVRLIFQFCDPDAVKALRECSPKLAELGYEYLVPPVFRSFSWRDDVKRLHAISGHDRLRRAIREVLIDFSHPFEISDCHASFLQTEGDDEPDTCLQSAWERYRQIEALRKSATPFDAQVDLLSEAFSRLPNLQDVRVTFNKTTPDAELLSCALGLPINRKLDRKQACSNLNALISAASQAHVSSLEIDRLPMELFKVPQHRQHWFRNSPAVLANLTRLDVIVDPSEVMLPSAKFRAINGFGHFLQFATNLEQLSLGFHNFASPQYKFAIWFQELVGSSFAFKKLTDLKLEGLSCDESDLRRFLERHGSTLKRLRLGGDWASKPGGPVVGGIQLGRGTFRSLFTSLQNRLPHLERVHLSGHFECGMLDPNSHEKYIFNPILRDDGEDGSDEERGRTLYNSADDGLEFERYLLRGGEYPGTPARSPSPQSA